MQSKKEFFCYIDKIYIIWLLAKGIDFEKGVIYNCENVNKYIRCYQVFCDVWIQALVCINLIVRIQDYGVENVLEG